MKIDKEVLDILMFGIGLIVLSALANILYYPA